MIRPVIIPEVNPGMRSQTYSLDSHPYAINYTIKDIENGFVEFQYNLYQLKDDKAHLLERIYFNAGSLAWPLCEKLCMQESIVMKRMVLLNWCFTRRWDKPSRLSKRAG
jgi:hypothetical protein